MNTQEPNFQNNAIKALAAASTTPFRTAFKVSMGLFLAQLTATFIFFTLLSGLLGTLYYVFVK